MAGVKWREEGERSTKYFLNAVKTREAMSTLDYLQTDNSQIMDTNSILKFSKEFYKNLYSERKTNSELDYFQYCPKISDSASIDLDKDITIEELKITLKTCKDSTPGLDGIPYCFYNVFANELLPLVLDAWKFSQAIGSLPQSQTTSCISLIPKAGKDKHNIKNWRPISLSSCDLKIITKAISLKVGKYLHEIIHESQMGFVPGRDINFNNRIMRTALEWCKEKDRCIC